MERRHPEKIYTELENLLCKLISIDTTNPPGNELDLCRYVSGLMTGEGIPTEIFESAPNRGAFVARIKGDGSKRPFMLFSHCDVVPAVPEDWSVPPFEGIKKDGFIWGRGAMDCKNTMATELMVALEIQRRGIKLKRDLIVCAPADEECLGTYGAGFMVDNHFDKIDAEYCINEGGGFSINLDEKNKIYICQNAEKGSLILKMTTYGKPGHGSVPKKNSAMEQMAKALNAIVTNPAPIRRIESVVKLINRMSAMFKFPNSVAIKQIFNPLFSEFIISQMGREDMEDLFRAMLRDTVSITIVEGGYKGNVIPEKCEATIDCRILPGTNHEEFINRLKKITGVDDIRQEFPEMIPYATESTTDCEFFKVIEEVIKDYDPQATVVPFLFPAATDSRFLRSKGMISYGFHPMTSAREPEEYLTTPHGIDERVPLDALHFGFDAMLDIVLKMCT